MDDHRERIIVLEQQHAHMSKEIARMVTKVDEMHAVLLQAKGAKWLLVGLAGTVGLLSGLMPKLWS